METREKTHGTYYGPLMMLGAALLFSMGGAVIKLIPWSALAINGVRNLIAAATMVPEMTKAKDASIADMVALKAIPISR